jgi:hypothetical protein
MGPPPLQRRRESLPPHTNPPPPPSNAVVNKRKRIAFNIHKPNKKNKVTHDFREKKARIPAFRVPRLIKKNDPLNTQNKKSGYNQTGKGMNNSKSNRPKPLKDFKIPPLISNMEKLRQLCKAKSQANSSLLSEVELRSLSKFNPCFVEDTVSSMVSIFVFF